MGTAPLPAPHPEKAGKKEEEEVKLVLTLTSTMDNITHLPGRAGVRRQGPGQPRCREAAGGSSLAAGALARLHGEIAQVGAERQEGKENPRDLPLLV